MTSAIRRSRLPIPLLFSLFGALLSGCPDMGEEIAGDVTLELRAAPGVNLATVSYDVSGNGFHKTGTVNVAHSTRISVVIGGIPAGNGYTITLTATDTSGNISCAGTATFNVTAGMTTIANVHLTCHVGPRTGSVLVNGTLNLCPTLDSLDASPAEAIVGHSLSLSGVASDLDGVPAPVSYLWTSDAGTITSPTSANATFDCTSVGDAHVTLQVSDSDCFDQVTITVTCSADPDADAAMPPDPAHVVINEVESSGGVPGDFIELTNTGGSVANLGGYVVKDNDDTHVYTIPAGTTLAPGAYLVVEEASLTFGLGGADSARLFDASAMLVDSYVWTAHAAVTYGRCPDGVGAFANTAVSTKGAANNCTSGMGASLDPWPTTDTVVTVDAAGVFGANLSDLAYQPANGADPAILWAVQNNPSRLYRITGSGNAWGPSAGEWASGKTLRYPNGLGSPDAEGVTQAELSSPAIYVAAERDNDVSGTSRLSVLRFDLSVAGATLTATHEWDLTSAFPAVGANTGFEAIAWVPDTYLLANGFFDERVGSIYDPAAYADHGTGVFFVALEGSGSVYAYALDHVSGAAQRVATVASGLTAVMALSFDRDVGRLWTHCDDVCNNRSTALGVETAAGPALGRFVVRRGFEAPTTLGNLGYEGMAMASESECAGGVKSIFFADDANTGGHALRRGTLTCGALL